MFLKDNRFYLLALGIVGLFVCSLFIFWVASGGPASEAQVRNASNTRTAIAKTEVYLLRPRNTRTPRLLVIPTMITPAGTTGSTPAGTPVPDSIPPLASPTNTPLFPIAPSATPLPTRIADTQAPGIPRTGVQDPAEFARWYFGRVWTERDYRNLWDNYLTPSFKANVGSGLFEDYVGWWDSVKRVEVNSVDVLENDGTNAWVRVNITMHMKDGNVVPNQVFDYDFLYDASRGTWMFDYNTE